MKKFLAVVLALIGICAAAAAVWLSTQYMDSKPILLTPPDAARSEVVALMDAVCDGDYTAASRSIYGMPNLGVDREAGSKVGILIWDAFSSSMSYELIGSCYTTNQGLAQDVQITCLDINSATANLKERSQNMLEERVAAAEDVSEIYDENNEYREELVMDVLYEAVEDALEEDARSMSMTVTVNLVFRDGKWWAVADEALLNAISGGILY